MYTNCKLNESHAIVIGGSIAGLLTKCCTFSSHRVCFSIHVSYLKYYSIYLKVILNLMNQNNYLQFLIKKLFDSYLSPDLPRKQC